MPPTPSAHSGSVRAPRPAPLEEAAEPTGRHRRPESLADINRLPLGRTPFRPLDRAPSWGHPAPDATGSSRRPSGNAFERHPRAGRHADARRANRNRGRHARPADQDPLGITVRPIMLGAVRDWALDTGDTRPATGSHRAPGTLPIESWLLIGKSRQQALLAGLVAAGLALVMLPTAAQRGNEVSPVTASGDRTATAPSRVAPADQRRDKDKSKGKPGRQTGAARPGATKPAGPAETPPAGAPDTVPAETPIAAVPPGDGPHRSLRTTGSGAIALTFDDGPDPVQTPRILALLDEYQVKATFCLTGRRVERHPEIVRQIAAAGHTLCNHTWDHSLVIGLAAPQDIEADLARTSAAIRKAVPGAQIPFFRAPGGNFTDRLVRVAYANGMTSLYWDVDPRDWDHGTDEDDATHVENVVAAVQTSVKPGSIVLSHDFNQPDTVLAYEKLLPYLTGAFTVGIPEHRVADS